MSLEALKKLVAPPPKPIGPGTAAGWKDAETKLGVALPDDYKAIVDCYGIGWFDNWICIYSPFSDSFNLFKSHDRICSSMKDSIEDDPDSFPPYPLFPAKGGLLCVGQSDNSDAVCYATEGKPKKWPIVTMDNKYLRDYHTRFDISLADLLVGWLSGKLTGECVRKRPKRGPVFVPGPQADYELMKKDGQ